MKRSILRAASFLLSLLIFIIMSIILLISLAVDDEPRLIADQQITAQDTLKMKELIANLHPRKLETQTIQEIPLTERDINTLLTYAKSLCPEKNKFYTKVHLYPGNATLLTTIKLPNNPFGGYFNLSSTLSPAIASISIEKLHVGNLNIPRRPIQIGIKILHRYLSRMEDYRTISEISTEINKIVLLQGAMFVNLKLGSSAVNRLCSRWRRSVFPKEISERALVYYNKIGEIENRISSDQASIVRILKPLFTFAYHKAELTDDEVAENRSLILALAMYSRSSRIDELLGLSEMEGYKRPTKLKMRLFHRLDLAQHFLYSAALSVFTGSKAANLIGLLKEVDDSNEGGTGFSFTDLLTNRAGVRFAEIAVDSPVQAKKLQRFMMEVVSDEDIVPVTNELPQDILDLELNKNYNEIDSKAFQLIEREIEARISSCRLYRFFEKQSQKSL